MKIVCAWCGGEIGEKDGGGVAGVSHSICRRCSDKFALAVETKESGTDGNYTPADEAENGKKEGYDGEDKDGYGVRGY